MPSQRRGKTHRNRRPGRREANPRSRRRITATGTRTSWPLSEATCRTRSRAMRRNKSDFALRRATHSPMLINRGVALLILSLWSKSVPGAKVWTSPPTWTLSLLTKTLHWTAGSSVRDKIQQRSKRTITSWSAFPVWAMSTSPNCRLVAMSTQRELQ